MVGSESPGSSRLSLNKLLAKTKNWARRRDRCEDDTADEESQSPAMQRVTSTGLSNSWSELGVPSAAHATSMTCASTNDSISSIGNSPSSINAIGSRDTQILDDMFKLLRDPNHAVREKALSTVFHLAQSSPSARDSILGAGGLKPILNEIQREGPADAQTARALFHLCMGDPLPPFGLVVHAIPSFQRLLVSSDDEEVLVIICYALSELTTVKDLTAPNHINKVLPPPLHARLITLLGHDSVDVRFRSLVLLKNSATADRNYGPKESGSQCADWFSPDFSNALRRCLRAPELQDEVLELIQALMVNHFDRLLRSEDLMRKYFAVVTSRMGFEARVLSSLCCVLKQATPDQVRFLRDVGCAEVVKQGVKDVRALEDFHKELEQYHAQLKKKP